MEASNKIAAQPQEDYVIDYDVPPVGKGDEPYHATAVLLHLSSLLASTRGESYTAHIDAKAKALGLWVRQDVLIHSVSEFVRASLATYSDKAITVLKNARLTVAAKKNTMFTGLSVNFRVIFDGDEDGVFDYKHNLQAEILQLGEPMLRLVPKPNTQIYNYEGKCRLVRGKITQEIDEGTAKGLRNFIADGAPFSYTTTRRHAQLGKYREHTDEITAILAALVTSYNSDCQYHDKVGTTLLMTFEKQLKGHLLETGRVGLIMRNGVPIVVDEVTMSLRAFKYSHHGVLMVKITVEFAVVNNGESATASTETFIEV